MQTLHFIGGSSIALLLGLSAMSTNIGCSSDSSAPANPTTTAAAGTTAASTTGAGGSGGAATTATGTGGTSTTGTGGASTTGTGGTSSTTSSSTGTGGAAPGCSGATPIALTVKNYLGWCTVGVNGGATSVLPEQVVCVAAGKIPLTSSANVGFDLPAKPWHDTDGDVNMGGDPGTLSGKVDTADITVSKAACAWTCCPTTGLADCPSADQCP